jgi:hypothetical protein
MAKWYTICPINPNYNSRNVRLTKALDLGHNIHFTIIPNWLNKLIGFEDLSLYHRQRIEDTQYMLVLEYEAGSLGEPDPEWRGEKLRSKQEMALEKIIIANLALWLTKPSLLGFELVLHMQDEGDKILRESFSTQLLSPHTWDEDNYLEIKDFEQAHQLNLALQGLQRTTSVWIAVWTLREALTATLWQTRFLFLWIVLETLFGTDIEIAYRISQRIGFFLSSDRKEAAELFKAAKNSYRWRSKIVHGMKLDKCEQEESAQILYSTENFVRKSLNKILNDDKLVNIFSNNKEREEYLDNLVFSVPRI